MKKTITTRIRENCSINGVLISLFIVAFMMLFINTTSAMYGGESESFETNFTNPVYTVTGNSSNLDGLNITFENGMITISPVTNYKPDNFTLIFFDNITNEIIKTVTNNVYHGGGGSSIKYVDRNVTVYEPTYINNTITSEPELVETIVEKIIYQDTGYDLWMIFLVMATGAATVWILMRGKGDGKETERR